MSIVEFLESVPVLSGLKPEELERLAKLLTPCRLAEGEVVIREGEEAREMYFVVTGTLHVTTRLYEEEPDEPLCAPLHAFGSRDLFGDMSFFDSQPRSATVHAATDSELLCLNYDDLEAMIQSDGCLASRLFAGMTRNLNGLIRSANQGVRLLYKRLIKYDDNFREILRMYSRDEELAHIFKQLVY